MHELSIAQAMIEQVEQICEQEGADRVTAVTVAVGSISGVDPEALRMAFPLAAQDTVAEGASLRVEAVRAELTCRDCGRAANPAFLFPACPHCGSANVAVRQGRELLIREVELQTAD